MNFVFDVDGTLCFDGKTIDAAIIDALTNLREAGHEILFASARPIRDLVPVLPVPFRNGKLVGGNGCFVAESGTITTQYFEQELVEQLHTIIKNHQLAYLADGEWDFAFTGDTAHPIYQNIDQTSAKNRAFHELEKICKLVLFAPTNDVLQELKQLPLAITPYKKENAIDLSPLGINKVAGLHQLGITDFIAFGNDENDQCLFEKAQSSFCVGTHEVGAYASHRITRDEVAAVIDSSAHSK